jgi:signal transduction histidine kinase
MVPAGSAKGRGRRMAQGLIHKVRNSLNALRAHVALLQKFSLSSQEPRIPQQLQKVEKVVSGLEELAKEYLALVSPEPNQWQEMALAPMVREVLNFESLHLEQEKITLREELDPETTNIYVDRAKLKKALIALVVNARQAMAGGGQLTVRVQSTAQGQILLEVQDTGSGIPAEERDRIFEPFFTTKPEGLGLGLAVVRRIIRDFRGQITFESEVGRGTSFRIVLPRADRQRTRVERQARHQQWLQPISKKESTHGGNTEMEDFTGRG